MKLSAKHHGDFYCLNCLYFFATEKKLESHNKVCENKDFCNVIMPYVIKTLKLISIKNLIKHQIFIYADLDCTIEKIHGCKNNSENSSTTKVNKIFHQVFQCLQYHHLEA